MFVKPDDALTSFVDIREEARMMSKEYEALAQATKHLVEVSKF